MARPLVGAAVAVLMSCAKSEWTADEVVGEFRAYGLSTHGAHLVAPRDCHIGASVARETRRFAGDATGAGGWGCIAEFNGADAAQRAHLEVRANAAIGRSAQRANVVLLLSNDFDAAAAKAYVDALHAMWGGE